MIKRYQKGNPFATDAVVMELAVEQGEISCFKVDNNVLFFDLQPKDRVYGLGENLHGINKRGHLYVSNNTDDPVHTEEKLSLYGAHNFVVIDGANPLGLFIDYPGLITYDIGFTRMNEMKITLEEMDADIYVITPDDDGESALNSIIRQFRRFIGRSYIPPHWAFGYGQSRWSYPDEASVRTVVNRHLENNLPLDMVYLDIDYMERYKDFTIDTKRFPDFEGLTRELLAEGIHLVPIIDAGVKAEKGYSVDDEGIAKGYFCKKEDGTVFEGAVWPGLSHFTDVLNPEARKWFGQGYKVLTDKGIDGFWNDMNEPTLFYTKEGLAKVWECFDKFKNGGLKDDDIWTLKGTVNALQNSPDDYRLFYHEVDGKRIRHDKVHNLYGYNMTRAAAEAFEELRPGQRTLLFSRSSYIGMHRYGGIWTGDNKAWWDHLLLNIKMMPSLNMCGFLYSGADLGGFADNTTEDLMMRWLQFGVFTPLMRNHAAAGTREKECYQFENIKDFANILSIRYGLLPYLYSEYMKAALRDGMYFRTLAMMYPNDTIAPEVEDQLFVGESMMIAPVYQQNTSGRYVYLPESMKMMRLRSMSDYDEEILPAGHHYVKAELNELLIFIRPNHLVPVTEPKQTTKEMDFAAVKIWGYDVDGSASYEYYMDDGNTQDYDDSQNWSVLRLS